MKKLTPDDIIGGAAIGLIFGYAIIGMLHMWYFSFTISNADCMQAKGGFVYYYCHLPMDWAWAILGLLWPLYWL